MNTEQASRVTLESLEQPNEVPYIGLEQADFVAIVGPLAGGVLLASILQIGLLGLGALAVVSAVCGCVAVYVTPDYLNVWQYLKVIRYHLAQPAKISTETESAESSTPTEVVRVIEADRATRNLTNIERFYPEKNAIEREDGRLCAGIKLQPPNLDFATGSERATIARTFTQFANKNLTFDIQFFATTRSFPLHDYLDRLQERLTDADIRENPVLETVIQETLDERPAMLEEAGTEVTHFYVIVTVEPTEVITPRTRDKSALEKLGELPLIGIPFQLFAGYREDLTEHHRRARMFEKLDQRIDAIEAGIVRELEGYDSQRLSTSEWSFCLTHLLEGIEPDDFTEERTFSQSPAVEGERDTTSVGADGGESA